MILFRSEHVQPILEGRKTQTRRFWDDERPRVKVGGNYWAATRLFKPEYRFARLYVTALDWMPLDPVSVEDALAEGYESVAAFQDAFKRINKLDHWPTFEMVWRVKFRLKAAL